MKLIITRNKPFILSLLAVCLFASFAYCSKESGIHVFGATDSIRKIDVEVVYYVPSDSVPLDDWSERLEYHLRRAQKFHARELSGQSEFFYSIYPKPFIASATRYGFPQDDVNSFYWHTINEVWHSGTIQFKPDHFPILLVLSDTNFSPAYDDWSRVCREGDCFLEPPHTQCAGYVDSHGEDRPGTRCGGARSVFWPEMHIGLGLVTADGWRVPIKGTGCVVYHEGIGHAIGLPHPEPIDDSVMGLAQYVDSINKTWINDSQKLNLGWNKTEINKNDLFSEFEINHSPTNPSATDTIYIKANYPNQFKAESIVAEYQIGIREPYKSLGSPEIKEEKNRTTVTWKLNPINLNQSVSYRVRIKTKTGECETLWNYLKVRH